ncbi:MAG: PBP1A family penicillin-binding protein [Sphingomonadales bacterium]
MAKAPKKRKPALKKRAIKKSPVKRGKKPVRRKKKPIKKKSLFFRLVKWGTGIALASVLALAGFFFYLSIGLPDVENVPPPGEENRIEIRDVSGELLAVHGAFYGDQLGFNEIPDVMVKAIISIEDRRFFEHGAIDFRGILRALWVNVWNMEVKQGASTITQQLAKNLFLTPQRTFKRKARELLLARRLEENFTKQEILSLYLNRVYFGSGAYGIDAASERFFGHNARRLSLAEAALLAGLVKAPSNYTPLRSRDLAYGRAGVVLMAMEDTGYIDKATLNNTSANPAPIRPGTSGGNIRYFTDWVADQIAGFTGPGRRGPFTVYTTLDKGFQRTAEASLNTVLNSVGEARKIGNGAVVVMALDGSVRAMVGGRSYKDSQFNRATLAKRQPGSAFKPVVYLAGFERGLKPGDTFVDRSISVEGWSPQNFNSDYQGEVTLREAFALSLNTVAVQVSEQAGRRRVVETAKKLGVTGNLEPHPSMALGVHLMTPLEVTSLYTALANGGRPVEAYAILEIRGAGGELIYRRSPVEISPVIREKHLNYLTDMLVFTGQAGTGKRARFTRPFGAKTGTSQDFRDAWFVGFSAYFVTGVWVGNDNDSPMSGVSGGTIPADIWSGVMEPIHRGLPPKRLPGLED